MTFSQTRRVLLSRLENRRQRYFEKELAHWKFVPVGQATDIPKGIVCADMIPSLLEVLKENYQRDFQPI
jgi:hypothetical protein